MTRKPNSARLEKNGLEWTVFGVSLAILLTVLAILVHAQFRGAAGPPELSISLGEVRRQSGHYTVAFEVRNAGDTTAENVDVEVVLQSAGAQERSTVQFPFVPRGGRRTGWVTFQAEPAPGALQARVLGYRSP